MEVNDRLFRPRLENPWALILTPLGFLIAVVTVSLDTLIWLALCFAFAAPMILSGIYEAFLDHRILKFLDEEGKKLPVEMRAKLLYIILVGNLDLAGHESKSKIRSSLSCSPEADIILKHCQIVKVPRGRMLKTLLTAKMSAGRRQSTRLKHAYFLCSERKVGESNYSKTLNGLT